MSKVTGTAGAATVNVSTEPAAGGPNVAVQVDVKSTLSSAAPQERGFFGSVVDSVSNALCTIKNKIVAFFRFIFCCSVNEEAAKKIATLSAQKTIIDTLATKFSTDLANDKSADKKAFKDAWKIAFNALPQDLQDAIVKEDLTMLGIEKGEKDADLVLFVNDRFSNPIEKANSLAFVRDLVEVKDAKVLPAKKFSAIEDRYLPSYLKHISSNLDKEIKALQNA